MCDVWFLVYSFALEKLKNRITMKNKDIIKIEQVEGVGKNSFRANANIRFRFAKKPYGKGR